MQPSKNDTNKMALTPFQKGGQVKQRQAQTGSLKPFVLPKRQPTQKPDIRQSDNYKNALANAQRYANEAQRASSTRGLFSNASKAVPRATADILLKNPIRTAASLAEIGYNFNPIKMGVDLARRRQGSYDRLPTFNLPGLGKIKTFSRSAEETASDVVEGKNPLSSAAWQFAEAPLSVLELAGIGKGISKGVTSFKTAPTLSQGLRKATPEIVDAFLPTTRGLQRSKAAKAKYDISKKLDQSIESIKLEKQKFQQEKEAMRQGLSFHDDEMDSQYGAFKKLYNRFGKGKTKEAFESMDVQKIKDKLKDKVAPNVIDNILYSQNKKDDEVLDSFLSMIEKEKKYRGFKFIPSEIKFKGNKYNKPQGLIKTIAKSPEYSAEFTERLKGVGDYEVRHQMPLVKQAQRTIAKNLSEAERIATGEISDRATIMADELGKYYDSIAKKAKASGDMETFNRALDRAKAVDLQVAVNVRESGRAISAVNRFNKQSPEGMLRTMQDIAEQKGTKLNLSNEQIFNFQRKAEEISKILDPRTRAYKTFELMDEVYEKVPFGVKDKLYEVLNLPRALMATADLSAPLRQGLFAAARNPKTFIKNFGKMFKYAFSSKAYRNAQIDIVTSPNYNLYVKHKLPLTEISSGLNTREEAFISQLAERIPLFGRISRGSNRAYTGFLNKMRTDLFDDFVKTAELNGIKDQKYFDDAARFVGAATGRGDIHKLFGGNKSGKFLSNFFFSPRLIASRISLLNPAYYTKLHPAVRKEALKSLLAFVGTGMGTLTLAKMAGAEVGDDPRSADFGKIKVGNTRYDIWGGFQQYARLLGQLVTGEKVSTITGKETQLGKGFGSPTRESIALDFFKSKLAPIPSFLSRAGRGTEYGEPFRPGPEVIDRLTPMIIQDAYDLVKERGLAGVAMETPAVFGVGTQTYGDQIPTMESEYGKSPKLQWRSQPTMGEDIYNFFTGKEVSNVPEDLRSPLIEERKKEQLREIDVDAAKARVLETGESEQVGDTFIYLKDGVVKIKKIGKDKRTPLKDQLLYEEISKRKANQPFYEP